MENLFCDYDQMMIIKSLEIFKVSQINKQQRMQLLRNLMFRLSVDLSETFSLKYKIKDVTKIRGLSTEEAHITIQKKTLALPLNKSIVNIIKQNPFNRPNENPVLWFLDKQLNVYHPSTFMSTIAKNSFYLKINQDLYYIANNQNIVKRSYNPEYIATQGPAMLEPIVRQTLVNINNEQTYNGSNINNLIIKNVLDNSVILKIQKIRLKEVLKVLDMRISHYQTQINQIKQAVRTKSKKRARLFSTLMLGQYAIIHYLIYFHLSWDIMEPITVIIMNLDLVAAYYYFVFKGSQYSLQDIQKNIQAKRQAQFFKKYNFNIDKYNQLIQLKEVLQFRFDMYTKSPNVLMDALQKNIKLIDTR